MSAHLKGRGGDLFMPTLLDRLVDNADEGTAGVAHLGRSAYRQTVLRDLSWLLNCTSIDSQIDLDAYPHVAASVTNFGIPPLAGTRYSELDLGLIAEGIRQAVIKFEPRVLAESLKVMAVHDPDAASHNQVMFQIRASFWFEPYPVELAIKAQWDIENGSVELEEVG